MSRHFASLSVIFLLTGAIYAQVSLSFFEGYDDFQAVHRAAFEDTQQPSRIFTTSHFDSAKYRPLGRVLDYATYHLGGGRSLPFRLRSLTFHLVSAAMVYGLSLLLFGSWSVAFPAGLLFALHPLANQCVVACTWTVVIGDAVALVSLFLFIFSVKTQKRPMLWLGLSLLAGCMALFIYESGIVILGLLYAYLGLTWLRLRRVAPSRRFVLAMTVGIAVVGAIFVAARAAVLDKSPQLSAMRAIIKNLVFYLGALVSSPFDSILAHDLFDTPLPSQMHMDSSAALPIAAGVGIAVAITALLWRRLRAGASASLAWPAPLPWMEMVFLGAGIVALLLPFLLFNEHASETYLYLPVAFYCPLLAAVLNYSIRSSVGYLVCVGGLTILFAAATYNRNRHVDAGAAIAQRIVENLPVTRWTRGAWQIRLAEADPSLPRYGMYGYQGLSTIDIGDPTSPGAECALQVAARNQNVAVRVVSAPEMRLPCPQPGTCFWVHADGSVSHAGGNE